MTSLHEVMSTRVDNSGLIAPKELKKFTTSNFLSLFLVQNFMILFFFIMTYDTMIVKVAETRKVLQKDSA